MIVNAIILICLFSAVFSFLIEKNIFNPILIFSIIWAFIFLIYRINPYDLPEANSDTLIVFLVSISCFIIGAGFFGNIQRGSNSRVVLKVNSPKNVLSHYSDDFYNTRLIEMVQIIGVVIYLYLGSAGIKAILSGYTLTYIRYYLRLNTLDAGINAILISYVVAPIMYFSITYTAAQIAVHNTSSKRIKRSILYSLFMIVMDLMTSGGRMGILYTLVCVFVCYFIYAKFSEEMSIKNHASFIFGAIVVLGAYLMWTMAASRGGTALKDTIIYLYAPISCFDRYRTMFLNEMYSYTFGLLSSQGFTRPIFKLLGLSNITIVSNTDRIYTLIDSDIWLNSQRFNSETTFAGYFYFDGGLIAVILFSLLFGFLCQKFYKKTISIKNMKLSFMCLYMFMIGTVALSFIQFSFASIGFSLAIVWSVFFSSKQYKIGRFKC